MIYGGSYYVSEFEFSNQLHVFDITTMTWSKPPLSEDDVGYRYGHMATCYKDQMIVMGGRHIALSVQLTQYVCQHIEQHTCKTFPTIMSMMSCPKQTLCTHVT